MQKSFSVTGGLQKIRQCVESETTAISLHEFSVPFDAADISISYTQVWFKEGNEDYFIESLNKAFKGEADFSLSTFDGDTLLEIITL